MTFVIALILGIFVGYKFKGATYLYKETRNVKFIKEIVDNILNNKELELIKSKDAVMKERESKFVEKHHFKRGSDPISRDELLEQIEELQNKLEMDFE